MTPFKAHALSGLILLMVGIVLDYTFVAARVTEAFRVDPAPYLHSWKHLLHDMTVSYMIILGFLNLGFALLAPRDAATWLDWAILSLMLAGTALLLGTGLWYASAGPSFKWEPRCTVLTLGLAALVVSIALDAYKLVGTPQPIRP